MKKNYLGIIKDLKTKLLSIDSLVKISNDNIEFIKFASDLKEEKENYYSLSMYGMKPQDFGKLTDLVNTFNITRASIITNLEAIRKKNLDFSIDMAKFKSMLPAKIKQKTFKEMVTSGLFFNLSDEIEIFKLIDPGVINQDIFRGKPTGELYSIFESSNLIGDVMCRYSTEILSSYIKFLVLHGKTYYPGKKDEKAFLVGRVINTINQILNAKCILDKIPKDILLDGFLSEEFMNIIEIGILNNLSYNSWTTLVEIISLHELKKSLVGIKYLLIDGVK